MTNLENKFGDNNNNNGEQTYPFTLTPLPYSTIALEPFINAKTMQVHYDTLAQRYVDRLNAALKPFPQFHQWSLTNLLRNIDKLPAAIQKTVHNNAGGVYNHELYFQGLTPDLTKPKGGLFYAIQRDFGSFEEFKARLKAMAMNQFGSGWAILTSDPQGYLKLVSVSNQDTVAPYNVCPIIIVDVWEHAYFLQYLADRDIYFENWFKVVDWDKANVNYENCLNNYLD